MSEKLSKLFNYDIKLSFYTVSNEMNERKLDIPATSQALLVKTNMYDVQIRDNFKLFHTYITQNETKLLVFIRKSIGIKKTK